MEFVLLSRREIKKQELKARLLFSGTGDRIMTCVFKLSTHSHSNNTCAVSSHTHLSQLSSQLLRCLTSTSPREPLVKIQCHHAPFPNIRSVILIANLLYQAFVFSDGGRHTLTSAALNAHTCLGSDFDSRRPVFEDQRIALRMKGIRMFSKRRYTFCYPSSEIEERV